MFNILTKNSSICSKTTRNSSNNACFYNKKLFFDKINLFLLNAATSRLAAILNVMDTFHFYILQMPDI